MGLIGLIEGIGLNLAQRRKVHPGEKEQKLERAG